MKKTLKACAVVASLALVANSAFAAKEGAYVGAGLGVNRLNTPNEFLFDKNDPHVTSQSRELGGVTEHLFAGYNVNPYFGVEAGAAHYSPARYKSSLSGNNISVKMSTNYYLSSFDLVGKGYIPLGESNFNLYGLAGAALVHSTNNIKTNAQGSIIINDTYSKTQNVIRPVVGAGVSYDIPDSPVTTSLEFRHVQGRGDVEKSISAIPSANLVSFNVAYNFD